MVVIIVRDNNVQTVGLIYTFTMQSKINDVAVSATHIMCGLSNGSVALLNIHTKEKLIYHGNGQPVVNIFWLPPLKVAVVAQNSVYIYNFTHGALESLPISGQAWGAVYLVDENKFLVGTLQPGNEVNQGLCNFISIAYKRGCLFWEELSLPMLPRQRMCLMLVGKEIVCITSPGGVQLFDIRSKSWTNDPPLLNTATSLAVSMNRNLVVQTKNSIQIFPIDVLTGEGNKAQKDAHPSHIYPLGKNYIICILQPTRNLTLLELETLQELPHHKNKFLLRSLLENQLASACGLFAEFGISVVVGAWESGSPLPQQRETAEDVPLCEWSPRCTLTVTVHNSPQWELCLRNAKNGRVLLTLPLGDNNVEKGEVYDITFDSETNFYLKIEGPRQHFRIPYTIKQPLGQHLHTITKKKPIPLSKPRPVPPYRLDANGEWVLNMKSKKICWVPPGNLRRGDGGHFWAGLSLVMLGDDGVVRKLTFKDPDC